MTVEEMAAPFLRAAAAIQQAGAAAARLTEVPGHEEAAPDWLAHVGSAAGRAPGMERVPAPARAVQERRAEAPDGGAPLNGDFWRAAAGTVNSAMRAADAWARAAQAGIMGISAERARWDGRYPESADKPAAIHYAAASVPGNSAGAAVRNGAGPAWAAGRAARVFETWEQKPWVARQTYGAAVPVWDAGRPVQMAGAWRQAAQRGAEETARSAAGHLDMAEHTARNTEMYLNAMEHAARSGATGFPAAEHTAQGVAVCMNTMERAARNGAIRLGAAERTAQSAAMHFDAMAHAAQGGTILAAVPNRAQAKLPAVQRAFALPSGARLLVEKAETLLNAARPGRVSSAAGAAERMAVPEAGVPQYFAGEIGTALGQNIAQAARERRSGSRAAALYGAGKPLIEPVKPDRYDLDGISGGGVWSGYVPGQRFGQLPQAAVPGADAARQEGYAAHRPLLEVPGVGNGMRTDMPRIWSGAHTVQDTLAAGGEELRALRDSAGREGVNRFTTAEIKIEQTNHNRIESPMDLDGIIDGLTAAVGEAVYATAEGVMMVR